MHPEIRKALPEETAAIRDFYYTLIDEMQESEYHPKWQKGVYPDDDYISDAVHGGEMYVGFLDGELVASMVLNQKANDGYRGAPWVVTDDDAIMLIHTLAVRPAVAGKGIGSRMVEYAEAFAAEQGFRAIHLDVIDGNLPAMKLYKGTGFRFVETRHLFYEDTGWYDFHLFEYVVDGTEERE